MQVDEIKNFTLRRTQILLNGHEELFKLFDAPSDLLKRYPNIDIRNSYESQHSDIVKNTNSFSWNGWIFRGHQDSKWKLITTLERLKKDYRIDQKLFHKKEFGMIREFQRQILNYRPDYTPKDTQDFYGWMAMLQHYGGSTRFLDFSYSFYVALFFAVYRLTLENDSHTFSIWAIDRVWLEKRYKDFLPEKIKELYKEDEFGKHVNTQKEILMGDTKFKCVINMNPYYLNKRLVRQQGLFLFPTNMNYSFEENLNEMISIEDNEHYKVLEIVVTCNRQSLISIFNRLRRMNINSAVLFQGVDGLLEDIKSKTAFPDDSIIIPEKTDFAHGN